MCKKFLVFAAIWLGFGLEAMLISVTVRNETNQEVFFSLFENGGDHGAPLPPGGTAEWSFERLYTTRVTAPGHRPVVLEERGRLRTGLGSITYTAQILTDGRLCLREDVLSGYFSETLLGDVEEPRQTRFAVGTHPDEGYSE